MNNKPQRQQPLLTRLILSCLLLFACVTIVCFLMKADISQGRSMLGLSCKINEVKVMVKGKIRLGLSLKIKKAKVKVKVKGRSRLGLSCTINKVKGQGQGQG